jgi:hypothetical protein
MNKLLLVVYVAAMGLLFSSFAMAADCKPACGTGQSCCVMQYSNGTYGSPYCKTGSCYTAKTNQPLKDVKEIDATNFKKNDKAMPETYAGIPSQTCNPGCAVGNFCCVMQYSNGTYSRPYCQSHSCYTSAQNADLLKDAKELNASAAPKQ